MKRSLAVLTFLLLVGAGAWGWLKRSEPPATTFAKTTRETLSSLLSTNGKIEPVDFTEVRAEAAGIVKRLLVHEGDAVARGQVLAELSEPGLDEELAQSQAREAQARADLETLESGVRAADVSELEASLSRLRNDREAAQRMLDSLRRLLQKQAATAFEVEQGTQNVASLDVQIDSLQKRRSALLEKSALAKKGEVASARARVKEIEAAVRLARNRISQDAIRAPQAGTVYDLPVRQGSFLNRGDLVASVGTLNPVRVRVYVDEPELGRVAPGEKVRITWDALPGREWKGEVQKRPSQVTALGTRQVGQVLCTVENPNRELLPGTNVNAFILTQVVEKALTIPKTAVRRENGLGVYVLEAGETVRWKSIQTGASDALRVEVVAGLEDGARVASVADQLLKDGQKVTAKE